MTLPQTNHCCLSAGLDTSDLSGLLLEDGDRVTIPTKPTSVSSVGAVINNNALLWKPVRKVSNYLDIAGVDDEADFDNLFVVRADGTVLHVGAGSATSKRWS